MAVLKTSWELISVTLLCCLLSLSIAQNSCDVDGPRTDCGHSGTTLDECEQKGCCWYPVYDNSENLPWCFYKNYEAPEPPVESCSTLQQSVSHFGQSLGNFFLNSQKGTYFAVWAPHADQVWISGEFSSQSTTKRMTLCSKDGYWATLISSASPGSQYNYLIEYQGKNLTQIDPLARQVAEDSQGNYIASIVHNPSYQWSSTNFKPPSHFNQVIYEMHIPTFNPESPGSVGTFADVIAQLDYLQHLGINVIEPLPVIEFPGDPRGWGYNPGVPFAIENAFGGYDGMKKFVDAANSRGIAVYVDIVWNHMNSQPQNALWQYDGWYEYEEGYPGPSYGLPGGIYFYQNADAETLWGPRPNLGTLRKYILYNVEMLMKECRVSGFRWDSTICVRKGGRECWLLPEDNMDGWVVLQDSTTLTRGLGGFSIAEDLQNNNTITSPVAEQGLGFDAQWSDTTWYYFDEVLGTQNDSLRVISDFVLALEGSYPGGDFGAGRVIYTENHDKSSGQNEGQGRWPIIVDPENPTSEIAQKLSVLGISTVLVSPGVPMLFYGQEFLDTQNFVFGAVPDFPWSSVGNFANGTWTSVGPWNGIFNLTRDLVRLRLNSDGVSDALISTDINVYFSLQSDLTVAFTRGSDEKLVVLMNLSKESYSEGYPIGVPWAGEWKIVFNSDLQKYSSSFGNVGASQSSVTAKNTPLHGFSYSVTVPLGSYSAVILVASS